MTIINEKFTVNTAGNNDVIDITKQVQNCVYQHALKDGLVCISIQGSTSAVTTIEYENGLIQDLREALERIAPTGQEYHHDEIWHDGNGYAHIRSAIVGSSVNVALIIAIIFSVLGMAGVITFLTLWHKGKLFKVGSTKAPIWVIASISVSLVISIVGTCMLFANTGGQGSGYSLSSPVGYWDGSYFTLDESSASFGNHYYLGLTKDFKVYRYTSNYWDDDGGTVSNPIIKPAYGVGSWSIRNKRLIITSAPEWELFYFEDAVTEYYAINGFGFARYGRVMNYGIQDQQSYEVKGYRWSHLSNYNPTGQPVKLSDIHFYDL